MESNFSPNIQDLAERQASLCRIFGSSQRILIIWLLAERERTVTEISLAIGATLQNTSQHLRIMEFRNLVESRREHHNIYYHIADNKLLKKCGILASKPKENLPETSLV